MRARLDGLGTVGVAAAVLCVCGLSHGGLLSRLATRTLPLKPPRFM
jgi:hypothetical protein